MVAVEMGERDPANVGGVDAQALERDQRARAAVEQQRLGAAVEEQAGLKAPAAGERVPGPDEGEANGQSRFSNQWSANGSSLNGATST